MYECGYALLLGTFSTYILCLLKYLSVATKVVYLPSGTIYVRILFNISLKFKIQQIYMLQAEHCVFFCAHDIYCKRWCV